MAEVKNSRFEFLDGLRGIAALAVIFFHFNGSLKDHGVSFIPAALDFFLELGHYGVQLFFVLSGFVIAYSLRHEHISPFFSLQFFFKRSVRLDPPYWAIVFLMLLLNFLGNLIFGKNGEPLATPYEVLVNMLYLPDFLQVARILPVAWTLCIEIQFYLIFVLLLLVYQLLASKFVFHALFGVLLLISLFQNTPWAFFSLTPGLFIPYWYSFFIGCLTCWSMLNFISSRVFWTYLSLIGIYCCIQGSGEALAVLTFALSIYTVAKKGGMHRLLTSCFIQYSGKLSYSLYLIHWPIGMKCMDLGLRFFNHHINSVGFISLLVCVSFALTFFAAHCFYSLIEYPSLWLSRRLKFHTTKKLPV